MNHNMLVIDIGTQSLRASVVSSDGNVRLFKQIKYERPYLSPKEGYAEQSADFYIDKLCLATNGLKEESKELMESIEGMVVVDFRDSSVILDGSDKPIRDSILWLDQRVTRLKSKNLRFWERLLFAVVGMSDAVKFNSERTSSFWIKRYEPDNWKKMKTYAPLGAYFNKNITGNLVVSSADCIGHYPIDFKHGKWLPILHPKNNVFGIPRNALPKLVPVGQVIGKVTKEFSLSSGIPENIPLYASGSDKACETFGNGCIDKTMAAISLGTACTIDVVDNRYSEPETFLPSYQAPYPGSYDLEVQIYRGLWMVTWYMEQFGESDRLEAEKQGLSLEDFLERQISKIDPGSDGLVLQPYWGPGLKRPNAKGAIIGFSAVHTRYHIYRAILEGIVFGLREGLDEIMKKTKKVPECIVVSGGGSRNMTLLQIVSDIFGIDVMQSSETESSTLGGAMSGFLASGVFSSPIEAKNAMFRKGKIIHPRADVHLVYDRLYHDVYLKMYPSMKGIYRNIKNFCLDNKGE